MRTPSFLFMLAAAIAAAVLFVGRMADGAIPAFDGSGRTVTISAIWAAGLGMGLTVAWFNRIDWAVWSQQFRAWLAVQRRRLGYIVLGVIFAGVILYF